MRQVENVVASVQQHAVHFVDDDRVEFAISADFTSVESVEQVIALEVGHLPVDHLAFVTVCPFLFLLAAVVAHFDSECRVDFSQFRFRVAFS